MKKNSTAVTAPTERELRVAAEWMRVARLMTASIQSRIDFEPGNVHDPLARYAPLKLLLNDAYFRELYVSGDRTAAKELRATQRRKYAQLLADLAEQVQLHQRSRLDHMDREGAWNRYGEVFLQEWLIRIVIVRLRWALWMHIASLPGAAWMATDACKNLRRLFPPAQIVPFPV